MGVDEINGPSEPPVLSDQFEVGPGSPIQYDVWQSYNTEVDVELGRVIFSIDGTVVATSYGDPFFEGIEQGALSNSGGNDSMTIGDVNITYSPEPNSLALCGFSSVAAAGIFLMRGKRPGNAC